MFITAQPSEKVVLSVQLTDQNTAQYPKAFLFDIDGNQITTIDLTHVARGLYVEEYTPDGTYTQISVQYVIYSDAGRTTINTTYDAGEDVLYVDNTVDDVWNAQTSTLTSSGSVGKDFVDAQTDISNIKKYELNRWKIINNQFIVYENDGSTPLLTFNLLDGAGNPTSTNPAERTPA